MQFFHGLPPTPRDAAGIKPAIVLGMPGLRDHTEFDVWKLSDRIRTRVEEFVKRPSFRTELKLRDQLSRAADGPPGHIAEGFSRFYPRDFARFVRIARGSVSEVIEHIGVAHRRGLVSEPEWREIVSLARRARGAATRLIVYLESATPPNQPRHPTRGQLKGEPEPEPEPEPERGTPKPGTPEPSS